MPTPISFNSAGLDLSARVIQSKTVTGSPAAATETIVCTLPAIGDIAAITGVALFAFAAFTVGTDGVSADLKIRRTNASGTAIVATGATNGGVLAAAQLTAMSAIGFDTGPTLPGQIYVATLTIASGSAPSTVSAATLVAIVV